MWEGSNPPSVTRRYGFLPLAIKGIEPTLVVLIGLP